MTYTRMILVISTKYARVQAKETGLLGGGGGGATSVDNYAHAIKKREANMNFKVETQKINHCALLQPEM